MPTYEYKCEACGHRFEKFQSIMAAPTRKCPKCKKNRVIRLISTGAGMIFKGSGFYITDYRSEGYKSAAKADSGAAPASSDAKPASDTKSAGDKSPTAPAPAAAAGKSSGNAGASSQASSGKSESKASSKKK